MKSFSPFLILTIFLCAITANGDSNSFVVSTQNTQVSLDLQTLKRDLKKSWQSRQEQELKTGRTLSFAGLPWLDFLAFVKKRLKVSSVTSITIESADGYQKVLEEQDLKNPKHFLVLEGLDAGSRRIYNSSLKLSVDWAPAYLILAGSGASPYQIKKIEINPHNRPDLLKGLKGQARQGAEVFMKACAKCHQVHGYGGVKGPDLAVMLSLYPEDDKLKRFLRDPQKDRPRQMSAFNGTEKELEALLVFLRAIEKQETTQRSGQ